MSLDTFLDWILEQQLTESSTNDILSLPAFHGKINRQAAEVLLIRNGQFLVRETRSNQFVLSCNSLGEHLHFMIHEQVHDNESRIFFFENESFDSVSDLLKHHLENSIPITKTSGLIIKTAVNRQTPINSSKYVAFYKKNSHKTWQELTSNFDEINNYDDYDTVSQKSTRTEESQDHSEILASPLDQFYRGVSAISLEASSRGWSVTLKNEIFQFSDLHLPNFLCSTDSNVLAEHFFRCDLAFFGVERCDQNCGKLNSAIEFALLPIGKQFRRDTIVRNECLKYFVIATLLKQTNCFDAQTDLLSKWIRIAGKLGLDYGDHFGFGAVMYGLLDPKIGRQKTLWHGLKARNLHEFQLFESCLVPKFMALLDLDLEMCSPNISLPFLITLFHMVECNSLSNNELLPRLQNLKIDKIIDKEVEHERGTGLGNFTLDSIMSGIVASTQLVGQITAYENNCRRVLNSLFATEATDHHSVNPHLSALFMTEFHLHFFFGTKVELDKINYRIFQTLELKL